MLKIFKEHVSKTSILDDFAFYENRQKLMQEKRVKQQQIQKQVYISLSLVFCQSVHLGFSYASLVTLMVGSIILGLGQ